MGLRRRGMMDGQTIHPVDTYVIYPHANGVSTAIVQMSANTKYVLLGALCVLTLVVIVACGGEFEPLEVVKAPFQNNGSASVEGTVTYRELIKLSPDARLVVELRDVSLADAPSILIARQTVRDPGQGPIKFKVEYDRDSIDPRNRYSITARIIEPPDRLAFINDTAHEVITRGKPSRVDMVLKLVEPPPEVVGVAGLLEPDDIEETKEASGAIGSSSVKGTVTYRERITLSRGARLILELQDVSYADADSIPVASQVIPNPGQVPIDFTINYDRDSIDPRNRYAIQARIIGSDGRLAFINDTAYEVITRGKPSRVDMMLVLVQPPSEMVGDSDWRTWVEVPVHVNGAELLRSGPDQYLRILYNRSTIDGCSRPGAEEVVVDGADIIARVTLMQPPDTPWAIPCDEQMVEMDTIVPLNAELEAGETYRVIVNDRKVTTIAMPPARSTR